MRSEKGEATREAGRAQQRTFKSTSGRRVRKWTCASGKAPSSSRLFPVSVTAAHSEIDLSK